MERYLYNALDIAECAHEGQKDKAGQPYFDHVRRVQSAVAASGIDAEATALLHDVVEDCPGWTFDRLREESIPEHIIKAVDCLTRRKGEPYDDFIARAVSNPLAAAVKIADLVDNLNLSRLPAITEADIDRAEKYLHSLRKLVCANKGALTTPPDR